MNKYVESYLYGVKHWWTLPRRLPTIFEKHNSPWAIIGLVIVLFLFWAIMLPIAPFYELVEILLSPAKKRRLARINQEKVNKIKNLDQAIRIRKNLLESLASYKDSKHRILAEILVNNIAMIERRIVELQIGMTNVD